LIPFCVVDLDEPDGGDAVFTQWALDMCEALEIPEPNISHRLVYDFDSSNDTGVAEDALVPLGYDLFKTTSSTILGDARITEFKIPAGASYHVGSPALALPENDSGVVDAVLAALHLDGKAALRVTLRQEVSENVVPELVTYK
jgi:sulfite reductase alpha subunit-like flavoprotein